MRSPRSARVAYWNTLARSSSTRIALLAAVRLTAFFMIAARPDCRANVSLSIARCICKHPRNGELVACAVHVQAHTPRGDQ